MFQAANTGGSWDAQTPGVWQQQQQQQAQQQQQKNKPIMGLGKAAIGFQSVETKFYLFRL